MPLRLPRLLFILLVSAAKLQAQGSDIDRLIAGELKMTYPSIYFRHNSTEYAAMSYTADSCFKYIAKHIRDINNLVIWRDSAETDELSNKRIKKLKSDLAKYTQVKIDIHPMGDKQKISRHTIALCENERQVQYLLSLNSSFDISRTRFAPKVKKNHIERPRIWCADCWKSGFHIKDRRRMHKIAKQNEKKNA